MNVLFKNGHMNFHFAKESSTLQSFKWTVSGFCIQESSKVCLMVCLVISLLQKHAAFRKSS